MDTNLTVTRHELLQVADTLHLVAGQWRYCTQNPVPFVPSHAQKPFPCCFLDIFSQMGYRLSVLCFTEALSLVSRSHGFVLLFCGCSKRLGDLCSQALCTL